MSISTLRYSGWADLLALGAGALVTLSLAPYNFWPAGIISCALLAWLLQPLSPARGTLRAWLYGVGMFGAGTSWVYVSIHEFGNASPALAAFLTLLFSLGLGLFIALPGYAYLRWVKPKNGGPTYGFAAFWVLAEWLRSWLLTGFPWLFLGYAHLDTPLAGWAPVAGVYGIGFIVALTGAVLAHHYKHLPSTRSAWLAAALWLLAWPLGQVPWTQPAGEPIRVGAVQANIPQGVKWQREQYRPTLATYRELSEPLWRDSDIVVWPEAAIPAYYQRARPFFDQMAERAARRETTLITGVLTRNGQHNHNSVVALGAGGGVYHKQRLVPFGEYVPLEQWLRGLIDFFDLPMSHMHGGPAGQALLRAGDLSVAPFICYEIVYPDMVARTVPRADLLLTISNDAWFGDSIGPLQHQQIAQMRALETGRYLIRATGSGVTTLVNQRGAIIEKIPQFERTVLRGEVKAMTGATPFAVTGSAPLLVLAVAIIVLCRYEKLKAHP